MMAHVDPLTDGWMLILVPTFYGFWFVAVEVV